MPRIDKPRIVINKVSPPRLPKTLERTRLFNALDEARGRPIIWITAPAGMGKTTLAATYLKIRKLNTLWYQIDEGDADPATLFQYLGVAATTIGGRKRSTLPNLTPEYLPSLSTFARRFFETLYSRLKSQGMLVLDNFQELPTNAPTQELLVLAGETLPSKMNFVILSRKEPPPAFAKLLANQSISLLNPESLLLTSMETLAICGLHNPSVRPATLKTQAQHIHERTRGWMAGTILLMESEKQNQASSQEIEQSPDVVFHYLAKEVFETFSEEIQQLLLKTAFFPFLTPEMAKATTGPNRPQPLLNKLYRSRYFVERHQTQSVFYRYHPLFQEFLQNLAFERLAKIECDSLLQETAQLLENAGQPEEAMKLWQTTDNRTNIIRLILTQAPILAKQGRFQVLQQWIRALPSNVTEQEPWLAYWLGMCLFPYAPREAKETLRMAFERFQAVRDKQGQLLALCGIIQAITNLWQDLSELDPWLEQLPNLFTKPELKQLSPELQATLAATMTQALMWRHPDHPEIDTWLRITTQHLPKISNLFHRHFVGFCMMTLLCWKGNNQATSDLLKNLRSIQPINSCPRLTQSIYYATEALQAWYCGNFPKSRIANSMAKTLMQQEQAWLHCGNVILGHEIYLGLGNNELSTAQQAICEMEPLESQLTGLASSHFHFMAGWVAVCEKKFTKASIHSNQALKQVLAMGSPFPEAEIRLGAAEICMELNQESEASTHIGKALDIANNMKSPVLQFRGFLLEARLALRQERHTVFLLALQKGMEVGRQSSILVVSYWRPDIMAELCAHALKHGIEVEYVQDLIRKRQLVPKEPPLNIPHWPWAVKISTLGRLAIEIDGMVLEWSRKAQRKPLQLLKCLIALGGKDIAETRLTHLLWPNADGDLAHQNFATTLHRLRKVLKYEETVILQDKQVSLNPRYCWIDIWAWDTLLSATPSFQTSREKADVIQEALSLYRGPFLPDEPDEQWAEWIRKRVQVQYLRLLEDQVKLFRLSENLEAGRQLLDQASQVEPAALSLLEQFFPSTAPYMSVKKR